MKDIIVDDVSQKISEYIQGCIQDKTIFNIAAMKNLSPAYNPNWESDGDLLSCLNYMKDYINSQNISFIKEIKIFQEKDVTPALFFTTSPSDENETYTTLLYTHIDKIPFGDGWTRCDPNDPKLIDGYVYGRGICTSIYAFFSIIGMLKVMDDIDTLERPNIAVLIESSFESSSPDLVTHLMKVLDIVPSIDQVICLNTWSPSDKHFAYMKSCRGKISFDVKITTGIKAVHSGAFGGLIPDPMMIFNNILSNKIERIQKTEDGKATNIYIDALETEISESKKEDCQTAVDICSFKMMTILPYEGISQLIGSKNEDEDEDYLTAYINGVLRPSYSILGYEDMPSVEDASGSLKPYLRARLCFRTPPNLDVNEGFKNLKTLFLENPPFNAKIEILNEEFFPGIDLEDENNLISDNMLKCFSKYCDEKGYDVLALRMARNLPCLNYLHAKLKNVPIFVTGAGDSFTGNLRDANECIRVLKVMGFSTALTCYVSDFNSYKNENKNKK